MHIGTMRNTMSTCAQYGIVGVPITIFFQCRKQEPIKMWYIEEKIRAPRQGPIVGICPTFHCLQMTPYYQSQDTTWRQ
jgi:hypothetical protein